MCACIIPMDSTLRVMIAHQVSRGGGHSLRRLNAAIRQRCLRVGDIWDGTEPRGGSRPNDGRMSASKASIPASCDGPTATRFHRARRALTVRLCCVNALATPPHLAVRRPRSPADDGGAYYPRTFFWGDSHQGTRRRHRLYRYHDSSRPLSGL